MAAILNEIVKHDVKRLEAYAEMSDVYMYAPEAPGDQFDASFETIQWRLDEVGKKMYSERVKL